MNPCVLQEDKCGYITSNAPPRCYYCRTSFPPTVFIQHEYIPNFSTPDQKCPFCTMYSFIESQTFLLKLRLALNLPIMSDWTLYHDSLTLTIMLLQAYTTILGLGMSLV